MWHSQVNECRWPHTQHDNMRHGCYCSSAAVRLSKKPRPHSLTVHVRLFGDDLYLVNRLLPGPTHGTARMQVRYMNVLLRIAAPIREPKSNVMLKIYSCTRLCSKARMATRPGFRAVISEAEVFGRLAVVFKL